MKIAAILSYINIAINIAIGLFLTPYIIRMLGDEEYGLYTLIGAFVGYLSVLDLGLNNAIVRYVAQYRAQKDRQGEENFLAISLIIYCGIAVILIFMGGVFYLNIESLFGETLLTSQLEKAKTMMIILIINIGFTLPGGAFTGICTGYKAFVFPRWISIIKYLVRAIMIVWILKNGSDALGIVLLDSILNITFICFTIWYVFQRLKIRIALNKFDWKFIREIFGYSLWIFIFGLVYEIQWRTGQVIIGTHMSTVAVAIFGIGVLLGIYYTTFGNIINRLLLPTAVDHIFQEKEPVELTNYMIQFGRISLMLLLFIFLGFLILGREFIILWIGENYIDSYYIAATIMFIYILPIAQGYAHSLLEAKKLLRFKTISFLIATIIGLSLGGILSYYYGVLGMITGIAIPMFLLQWVVMNFFYYKRLNLNILLFFKNTFGIWFVSGIVMFFALMWFEHRNISWVSFIIKCAIYSILFIVGMLIIMNSSEKSMLKKIFIRK
ncbi:MAG: hypothetical protein CMC08_01925 [Flavobacteriaceae bacterium]|nr:hypothetical protein [Flavobacteriaceae bacterium]